MVWRVVYLPQALALRQRAARRWQRHFLCFLHRLLLRWLRLVVRLKMGFGDPVEWWYPYL